MGNLMSVKSVAIVTGSSQGIGQATALRLARDFAAVVLVARTKDKLEKTACAVKSAGVEAAIHALDLREPQAAETIVAATLERFARIDALLNIAGAVPQIDLFEMKDAQWDDLCLTRTKWRAVSIWCKRFSVNFGAAALKSAEASENRWDRISPERNGYDCQRKSRRIRSGNSWQWHRRNARCLDLCR
jgi:NAD(P)-dependent dehydrogenase (short-subunit alcohol dehydrogenase family)